MKDLLPNGWKLWHPVVLAVMWTIGTRIADPVITFVLSLASAARG